ncbi:MAG: PH domain-containing protein [Lachnospiraceae bacterium]|nr:PH domain-containing protein [Lachnospiraceae bacterium]
MADYESVTQKGELHFKEPARLLFFGLPWTFRTYFIYDNDLVIRAGLLNQKEDDCYMYRITDVRLNRTFSQRIFGLSSITLYTSDVSDSTIVLKNIRKGHEIKDFILENAERCRLMRRTVNMQNIGYENAHDLDDIHPGD